MSKLLLIDGNAILHRAYHALPPLNTPGGEPINAIYGFVSMLLRILADIKPTHIAVAFDTPKPTFRKSMYAGYQAHRPQLESDLTPQFQKAYDTLSAMNIPIYAVPGYEADDVLGTIARQADGEVVIVTGDKDILQLVDDRVKVYMPIKGLKEAKLFNTQDVQEKMGVPPTQIPDLKAFMGDPSDNYPGVNGIGPKTAISLLSKYKSVEEVYENLGKVPEKTAKKLAIDAEMAMLGKKLATIVKDVPVTVDMDACNDWRIDRKELFQLFDLYGFRTLKTRVENLGREIQKEKQISLI